MLSLIVLIIQLSVFGQVLGGTCPPADTIRPCTCSNDRALCKAKSSYDLSAIFETIRKGHPPGTQQFDAFTLLDSTIVNLPKNVFHGVQFKRITILDNLQLDCIHPEAFGISDNYTTYFFSEGNKFSILNSTCNIFAALSQLTNLEKLYLIDNEITSIPDNAFDVDGGVQDKLKLLYIIGRSRISNLISIGSNAFSAFENLQELHLSSQSITKIKPYAFEFYNPSNIPLKIYLYSNPNLTGDSFANQVFLGCDRNTTLNLSYNPGLKYLKQDTFHQFLENKLNGINKINLRYSPLAYTKENVWLFNYKDELDLTNKLFNVKTTDGKSLWETNPNDYTH